MRQWIGRQMMRPWVARITCMAMFLFAMFWVRESIRALKATHDTPFIVGIGVPTAVVIIGLAAWIDRKGY